VLIALDSCDHCAHRGPRRSDLFGRPERAQLLKHSAQGLKHRPAAVAAGEVSSHAGEMAAFELAVEVIRDPVARLVAGGDPGFQEEVQHVCLDAERGAFMSYGADYESIGFQMARLVDRIFKGAKPSELPIEPPGKVELVVNLQTAEKLGVTIPQSASVGVNRFIK